jgi:hypothetical protein
VGEHAGHMLKPRVQRGRGRRGDRGHGAVQQRLVPGQERLQDEPVHLVREPKAVGDEDDDDHHLDLGVQRRPACVSWLPPNDAAR